MQTTEKRRVNSITEGVIWKQLLIYFFPILLGTFFQQMYNTVDAMVVGRAAGTAALAAVGGATATLINLMVGFFVGLSSGATVIISQFYGAKKDDEVSKGVHTAAAMALTFGALLMAVGICFAPTFLRWMNTPENVLEGAAPYLRIYFAGMIPSLIYNIGSGVLRAVGDSRRPLYFLMASCLTNIVLDLLFVAGLDMGVPGAALATVLAQTLAAALVVRTLSRADDSYRLDVRRIRFHRELLGRIARIGLPAGFQSIMYASSNVMIQAAINSFGTTVVAGWTIYEKLDAFFWMVVNAYGVAVTTFVGQNFGAGKYDRVRKSIHQGIAMAAISTICLITFMLTLDRQLCSIFTSDPEVTEAALFIIRILIPTYLTYVAIELLSGALRGAGDALVPTVITLFGVCMLRVIWLLGYVPTHHEVLTVILCYPITWIITSIAFISYYLSGHWLKRCIRLAGNRKNLQEM